MASSPTPQASPPPPSDVSPSPSQSPSPSFLDTVAGEIAFFKSLTRYRPIGIHRHFNVLCIRIYIQNKTGHIVSPDEIWRKLRSCYELDTLEVFDLEAEMYTASYSSTRRTDASRSIEIPSPSPSQNLDVHPFFREEYSLMAHEQPDHEQQQPPRPRPMSTGADSATGSKVNSPSLPTPPRTVSFESLMTARRLRDTPETPSPPPSTSHHPLHIHIHRQPTPSVRASPSVAGTPGGGGGTGNAADATRLKSKLGKAGLVAGDSDSSDLTQESGDDEGSPMVVEKGRVKDKDREGRESVVTGTGTDVGSDNEDGMEVDTKGDSETVEPESAPPAPKAKRGRKKGSGRGRGGGGGAAAGATKAGRKRKR